MLKTLCPRVLAGVAVFSFMFSGAVMAHENEKETASLAHKSHPKWTITLPKEVLSPVSGEIPITHLGGSGFRVEIDGTALAVDTKAKGVAGFMALKAKAESGKSLDYSLRFVNSGGWKYASSGVMSGKLRGVEIRLIDQDNNGNYNDFGKDAMIVGNGDSAAFLSRVINISGNLFNFDVNALGNEMSITPYTGAAGTLNLANQFTTQGHLDSAVVTSTNGDWSFDLADAKKGMLVPVGDYSIAFGRISAGAESAKVRAGRMKTISVASGAQTAVAWGGPIKAEIKWTHANGELTIAPTDLTFYGAAGEEYYNWIPDGQSPKFIVKDAKTGKEILKAMFGGC